MLTHRPRLQLTHLSLQALDQVADGHTRGDGVRVHDEVGGDPLAGERHVLLVVGDPTRTLLAVPTGKLVPDLRYADRANSDLAELVAILVDRQHHLDIIIIVRHIVQELMAETSQFVCVTDLINDSILTGSKEGAGISLLVPLSST